MTFGWVNWRRRLWMSCGISRLRCCRKTRKSAVCDTAKGNWSPQVYIPLIDSLLGDAIWTQPGQTDRFTDRPTTWRCAKQNPGACSKTMRGDFWCFYRCWRWWWWWRQWRWCCCMATCDFQGGKKPLRRAPPYPPASSQKMLERVEEKALDKFDRDFRFKIGQTSPEKIDSHITVCTSPYVFLSNSGQMFHLLKTINKSNVKQ